MTTKVKPVESRIETECNRKVVTSRRGGQELCGGLCSVCREDRCTVYSECALALSVFQPSRRGCGRRRCNL